MSTKLKVRVLTESYGSPRDPVAKRGDVIDIERKEFDAAPDAFEDIEASEKLKQAATAPVQDPWFMEQKEALRAEREAAAAGKAIAAEHEAARVDAKVKSLRAEAGEASKHARAK